MFIPSMYKSAPQVITATIPPAGTFPFDVAIPVAVNPSYTRVTLQGYASANASGFVPPGDCRFTLLDGSTVRIYNNGGNTAAVNFIAKFLIEEYTPFFLRQAIYYGSGTLLPGSTTKVVATGLTLGARAYVLPCGNEVTNNISQLEADETCGRLDLNIATGEVTITRLGIFEDGAGDLTTNFMVIDPK